MHPLSPLCNFYVQVYYMHQPKKVFENKFWKTVSNKYFTTIIKFLIDTSKFSTKYIFYKSFPYKQINFTSPYRILFPYISIYYAVNGYVNIKWRLLQFAISVNIVTKTIYIFRCDKPACYIQTSFIFTLNTPLKIIVYRNIIRFINLLYLKDIY